MLLIQISDIHCGPMFRQKIFRSAIKEINGMSPDVVLITGDLTENGLISEARALPKISYKNAAYSVWSLKNYKFESLMIHKLYDLTLMMR